MIPKKDVLAFYTYDNKGRHRYEIYTPRNTVTGEFFLKKGEEIPKRLVIELKIKDTS